MPKIKSMWWVKFHPFKPHTVTIEPQRDIEMYFKVCAEDEAEATFEAMKKLHTIFEMKPDKVKLVCVIPVVYNDDPPFSEREFSNGGYL